MPRGTKTVPFHDVAVLLLLHGFFCFVLCALTSFASYTLLSMRHCSYALLPFYPLERVDGGEGEGGEATMTRGSCTNGKKAWPGMVVIVGGL